MADLRDRFPAVHDGWARFDGAAGTQVVDSAIAAMVDHLSSGAAGNVGGHFGASKATGELVARTRASVAELLGADPAGVVFGPSATNLLFAFTRAVAAVLAPDDEIVCTQLDHDSNVTSWARAAADAGATIRMAEVDPGTGRLDPAAIEAVVSERTRWVAVSGASNATGFTPDLPTIVEAAHAAGAKVLVDAVHLAAHRLIDLAALGADALVTSPYKWYGPHAGVLCADPGLLATLPAYKVRPAPDEGPGRWETGTAQHEVLAGVDAAARFLLEQGMANLAAEELERFSPLLEGLLRLDHVTVHGPQTLAERTPTLAFTVAGRTPAEVAAELASEQIAVWSGDYYARELFVAMGLWASGGAVRAGISCYTSAEDVARLLTAVAGLA